MTILGLDPGTAITGYAFLKKLPGNKFDILDFGVITTKPNLTDAERLNELATDLTALIKKHKPTIAGIEKLFFTTNQKTVIQVAQSRGVALQTLAKNNITIREFTPLQVKSSLTGYGKATKQQVQLMVQKTFKLSKIPKPDDAADALAIALTTSFRSK